MKPCALPVVLLTSILALYSVSSSLAYAEGPLQERFKTKLKERVVEKFEDRAAPESNASVADKITNPGDYYFSIPYDDLTRFYRIHVPPGYNPLKPTALIFALHGGGGDMEHMAKDERYGLISKSDQDGFVVVFPNGFSKFKSGKFATWNAGTCCGDARDKNVDDVGFVTQMIKNITGQMNIDRGRIFAIGMSNGGMLSHRLACEMPGTFKAVASVAGPDSTTRCNPGQPVSVLHIHAKNDDHVLFNGGTGAGSFKDESKITNFTSVPETISRWVQRNHCNPTPARVLTVAGAYCDLYSQCDDGAAVKLCVTETGAHSWPGGHKPRGETTSKAISANNEIWNFFKNLP
jgi:polyhydroxybutyrate depolymerase